MSWTVRAKTLDVMTNWLNTVITRRNRSSRHVGAGLDSDMLRTAHELSLMEQGSSKHARTRAPRTAGPGRDRSFRTYPDHVERMADRSQHILSTR